MKRKILILTFWVFAAALGVLGSDNQEAPIIYVSWGDQIVIGKGIGKLDTAQKIEQMIKYWHKSFKTKLILWRVSSYMLLRHSEMRNKFHRDIRKKLFKEINHPYSIAVKTAHKYNIKILAYTTIWDLGAPQSVLYGDKQPFPYQSHFTIKNPQYQTCDKSGKHHYGVLELAYPEARKYLISRAKKVIDEFGFDGVYWCTRCHMFPAGDGDRFGYSKIIVDEYKKLYGKNILKENFDKGKWRKLRGGYFVKFLNETRKELPGKMVALGIPRGNYIGPPYGNMFLPWQEIMNHKLVDCIILGVNSGAWLYPKRSHDYKNQNYLCSDEKNFNVPGWSQAINKVYGPLAVKNNIKLGVADNISLSNDKLKNVSIMLDCPKPYCGLEKVKHYDRLNCANGRMTVEFRIKIGAAAATWGASSRRIFSKYGHSDKSLRGFEGILNSNGSICFRVYNGNDYFLNSNEKLEINKWYHIAFVMDGKRARIYINGRLDKEWNLKVEKLPVNRKVDFYFGRYAKSDKQYFDGCIDEFIIWNKDKKFTEAPTKPYSDNELKNGAVMAFHFDHFDKGEIPNLAVPKYPAESIVPGELKSLNDPLVPAPAGFGNCLYIGSLK